MREAEGHAGGVEEDGLTPGLRSFLAQEKSIYPRCPQRVGVDAAGVSVVGNDFPSYWHGSRFGAERPGRFWIKGVWIPRSECACIAADLSDVPSAFRRQSGGETCFLFLIHPESETLFAPLLQRMPHVDCEAMSLSSVRTLLVWIPSPDGAGSDVFFVKLSLNAVVSDAVRLVSDRECQSSIGNSLILGGKRIPELAFMGDACAFVPAAGCMDGAAAVRHGGKPAPAACGMIVRLVPKELLEPEPAEELFPLFSLFHGNGLLEGLVRRSGLTASRFLEDFLLRPFAKAFVELLFFHHVSIEAHGQNLLWAVATQSGLPQRLMYRDMGGVNPMLTPHNVARFPPRLFDESSYHQGTHLEDACDALEWHWVASVLFNLNKRLVRSPGLIAQDGALRGWYAEMEEGGFLCNWIAGADDSEDEHLEAMPEARYMRYGHVERLFQAVLVAEVRRRGIFQAICRQFPYFSEAEDACDRPFHGRSAIWFRPFLYTLYSHWMECGDRGGTETRP